MWPSLLVVGRVALALFGVISSSTANNDYGTPDCSDTGDVYRGTLNLTVSGLTCQWWDAQSPHSHTRTPANYPNGGLEENYCRNPDGEDFAWCYTTHPSVRWQECDVCSFSTAPIVADLGEPDCSNSGRDYRGGLAHTMTGLPCQRWNSQSPHSHSVTPDDYPNAALDENYCRNPDGEASAWCYTIDPDVRWQFCDVCTFVTNLTSCWDVSSLPSFRPLPSPGQVVETLHNLSITSCYSAGDTADAALRVLTERKYGLTIELGDNVYSDTLSSCTQQAIYATKKLQPAYAAFVEAGRVVATWDDHDFCYNNRGADCGDFRVESQQNFLDFFNVPADDPRRNGQEGIYSAKLFGSRVNRDRVHVITLDSRYHRSPTYSDYGTCLGASSTMLGMTQWDWLEGELARPSEVTIIASGIQVLPPVADLSIRDFSSYCAYDGPNGTFEAAISELGEHGLRGTEYEAWAEMPQERAKLLRLAQGALNAGNTKAVVFVSGDQHWGELSEMEMPASADVGPKQTVYELTGSGLGANWQSDSIMFYNDHRANVSVCDDQNDGVMQHQCVFPFIYDGVTYNKCTMVGHNVPWCSYQVDSDGVHVGGQWGVCGSFVNNAPSNFGEIEFDWVNNQLALRIVTPDIDPIISGELIVPLPSTTSECSRGSRPLVQECHARI